MYIAVFHMLLLFLPGIIGKIQNNRFLLEAGGAFGVFVLKERGLDWLFTADPIHNLTLKFKINA
jgi:hypothetical protein